MDAVNRFSYSGFCPEKSKQEHLRPVTFLEAVYLRLASLKGYGDINKIIRCASKWCEWLANSLLIRTSEGLRMLQSLEVLSRAGKEIKGILSILKLPKTTWRTTEKITQAVSTIFDPHSSYKKKGRTVGSALLGSNRMFGHLCRTVDLVNEWGFIRCSELAMQAIRGASGISDLIYSTTGISKASYCVVTYCKWAEEPTRTLHRKLFVNGCLNFLKYGLSLAVAILGIVTLFTVVASAWWLLLISSTLLLILSLTIYYHRMLATPQQV